MGGADLVILCFFLCIACYHDYRRGRIPNWLVLAGLSVGLLRAFYLGGPQAAVGFIIQGCVVILVFYPLFSIGTFGAGDLKLFGVCCGYLPQDRILSFLFFALLFAAVHSFIRFTRREDCIERFTYFFSYLKEVADSGEWKLYWRDRNEMKKASVCLAGPILLSMIMYMGGLY